MRDALADLGHRRARAAARNLLGPRAPVRKRPRRLAKKIAKRGCMLRSRGFVQSFFRRWPEAAQWFAGSSR
jgi:hypothetical protein